MTAEARIVSGILIFACGAMAGNRLRHDIIAILVMLMLFKILNPGEAPPGSEARL